MSGIRRYLTGRPPIPSPWPRQWGRPEPRVCVRGSFIFGTQTTLASCRSGRDPQWHGGMMCDRCANIDVTIAYYKKMLSDITDQAAIIMVNMVISNLESDKAALHAEPTKELD
jgi:hypothetical protein